MLAVALQLLAVAAAFAAAAYHHRLGRRRRAAYGGALLLGLASVLLAGSTYIWQKWLGYLLMPAGLLWLGLLALSLYLLARGQRRIALAAATLFAAYWLAGNAWVGGALMRWLERDYAEPPSTTASFDAVVVLGGGTNQRPWQAPQLAPAGDRLVTALRLYHAGRAQRVVCFGAREGPWNYAEDATELAHQLAVPSEHLIAASDVLNTRDEIAALARLIDEHGWQRVALVTSAWHMRRAMRLAARQGLQLTPIAADYRGERPTPTLNHLLPMSSAQHEIGVACWELLGAAVGR